MAENNGYVKFVPVSKSDYEGNPKKQKLTDWANEPTVANLEEDLSSARSSHDSHMAKVQEWNDNRDIVGSAKMKKLKGRSSVQPKLIRKQAEWRYPALSEPFLSDDDIFDINPVTAEDVLGAQQNQLILSYQWNCLIDKVAFIDEYVRAAVDEGTAIVKVNWDFQEAVVKSMEPAYEFVTPDSTRYMKRLQLVISALQNGEYDSEIIPDEWKIAVEQTLTTGVPVIPVQAGFIEVEKTKTVRNQPEYEVCDLHNVVIDPTCEGVIEDAQFVIYSFESSLDDLRKEGGYKNLDKLNVENASPLGSDETHKTHDTTSFQFSDKTRKKFIVRQYWGNWDIKGDGVTSPILGVWANGVMIKMIENPYPDRKHPFVKVEYLPVRKSSLYGEPDGELLKENQDVVGAIQRGMIDTMARSANGQTGMRKDLLDPINRRKFDSGDDYEYNINVDPRMGIHQHTYPEIPSSAPLLLQIQNNEAESMSGVKAFSQSGLSSDGLGNVATGIRGVLDAASKRELGILRRLIKGLETIARKTIAMNAEFLDEEEVIRITNDNFAVIRRDDLAGNYDLKISISSAEVDNAKAAELAFMLQAAGDTIDQGMRMKIMAKIARLRKMPDLAKDLETYEPPKDPLAEMVKQLEIEKLQLEIEQLKSNNGKTAAQIDKERATVDKVLAEASNVSADTDLKNLDYVNKSSGVDHARKLELMSEQAESQGKTKVIEALLNPKL